MNILWIRTLTDMSPFYVPLAVFVGGLFSPFVGWAMAYLDSRKAQDAALAAQTPGSPAAPVPPTEKLDWLRVGASAVIGLVAGMIFFGQYASAASVGLPDLELALAAGFAGERAVKDFIKVA